MASALEKSLNLVFGIEHKLWYMNGLLCWV